MYTTHLPSGETAGSATRCIFIMSANVIACLPVSCASAVAAKPNPHTAIQTTPTCDCRNFAQTRPHLHCVGLILCTDANWKVRNSTLAERPPPIRATHANRPRKICHELAANPIGARNRLSSDALSLSACEWPNATSPRRPPKRSRPGPPPSRRASREDSPPPAARSSHRQLSRVLQPHRDRRPSRATPLLSPRRPAATPAMYLCKG